ncbi:hypothetical protein MD484_g5173, partial [Candolleomyces efflorescens]
MLSRTDSQITLTNPEPALELVLKRPTSILNTHLLVNGKPRFQISTVDRNASITKITDLRTQEVVVTIHRKIFSPDKIKFPRRFGGKSVKKDAWMSEVKLTTGNSAWLINSNNGKLLWRRNGSQQLVLTTADDASDRLAFFSDKSPRPSLCVERSTEETLDEILAGFIILEHRSRMDTKRMTVRDGTTTHHSLFR